LYFVVLLFLNVNYNCNKIQKMSQNSNALPADFSSKTIPCNVEIPDLRDQIKKYFLMTHSVYERLFSVIKD
jgi:hypothetical protein